MRRHRTHVKRQTEGSYIVVPEELFAADLPHKVPAELPEVCGGVRTKNVGWAPK